MAPPPSQVALQAAIDGNLRLLKKMAKKVSLQEARDIDGRNALHLAAARAHLAVCRFLVEESGLDVNSASAEAGESPVLLAAAGGDSGVLEYLVGRGGDPKMADARGSTPLHDAAERGHCETVRLLLAMGVEVDALGQRGTPLHLAAGWGHDQALKILLEHGADPNRIVHHTLSPLMMACCARSLKCIKLLVEAGADVNLRISYGSTVLVRAVDMGLTDIVKFLLEAGADPNVYEEVHGRIPIMIAAAREDHELVEILFPRTKPIASLPNWSVDGIIDTMKYLPLKAQDAGLTEGQIADAKSRGNVAFKKGEYLSAIYLYGVASEKDPHDATLFANRSLCWLRLGDAEHALFDARHCKRMRPSWSKAWYREGAALSLLKDHEGAVNAFTEALKLEPENGEIKKGLRQCSPFPLLQYLVFQKCI
ncbi:hypothetical protein EJB05_49451 [Eragrostis curvula]|uniref:Uncharacterized protein n=1 Tax=Eragrostis curvula TaxID=38414 RepID=A0A5J9T4A9_9POAL|nr:hypothetical protein EJB05_49451 [Eragrostis curvula]